MAQADTKTALLTEAERLIRTKGYAAFSYADLSESVGIRKASIHHHFPTKEDLGTTLIDSYLERFVAELEELAARSISPTRKLLAYGDLFATSLKDGQMPLCGALAADAAYLPASMQRRTKKFFELHLAWLERILSDALAAREIEAGQTPKACALLLLSTLQGASVVAWALKDPSVVKPAYRLVIERLAA
ncbi:MAG: TetR/AcrR family transcriptional regulator [Hyphomicrobium sp.]|jgi:TetR/AcrR family transcriptional repressor of nem operon|nr:TetR/AcrR family transcriptional regulator [Hyphomicrobium sp.]